MEILVWQHNSIFNQFKEILAPSFPLQDLQIKLDDQDLMKQLNSLTFDVELRLLSEQDPLINIFLLNVNNYEVYKNVVRERLINFMNNVPITEGIIVFFPSIYRIDDKLNKQYLSLQDQIFLDLVQYNNYPRERLQKIIIYGEKIQDVNRENCTRDLMTYLKKTIVSNLQNTFQTIQTETQHYMLRQYYNIFLENRNEPGWSFWKMYVLKEQMANLLTRLKMHQFALICYEQYTVFFMNTFAVPQQNGCPSLGNFNSIHPIDFTKLRTQESLQLMFEQDEDESQGTILDFFLLLQFKIFTSYIQLGKLIEGLDKILQFQKIIDEIIRLQIQKLTQQNQLSEQELILWQLGLFIWQYQNMRKGLSLFTQSMNKIEESKFHSYQHKQLNINMTLLNYIEKIGNKLYFIDFQLIKSMSIIDESRILERTISGDQEQQDFQLESGSTINLQLKSQLDDVRASYLLTLHDQQLKTVLSSLKAFTQYYNYILQDVVTQCKELTLHKLQFSLKFDLLKLHNLYPNLEFNSDFVKDIVESECEGIQLWKSLYGSVLIHKLIYMHLQNQKQPFMETFSEAIQHKQIPGSCFTQLFFELSKQSQTIIKMKDTYFGYFEQFAISNRLSCQNYEFTVSLLKYFSAEPEGYFQITLNAKGVGKDRKKIILQSKTMKLMSLKKQSVVFEQIIPYTSKGYFKIRKVVFLTGKFKLYFVIAQKFNEYKVNFHNPVIRVKPILEQNSMDTIVTSNLGKPCLLKILEIPHHTKQLVLNFQTQWSSKVVVRSLSDQITVEQNTMSTKITSVDDLPINLDLYLVVFAFTPYDILNDILKMTINLELINDMNTNAQLELQFTISNDCSYQLLKGFDGLQESSTVIEIRSIEQNQFEINKHSDDTNQNIDLEVLNKNVNNILGGDQIIRILCFSQETIFLKNLNIRIFQEDKLPQNIILMVHQPTNLSSLIQEINKTDIRKPQLKLFDLNFQTVISQEQNIPFKKAQQFNIILNVKYMGSEDEVGDYAFDLGANRIQFKGTSKVNNQFTMQQTLYMHNFVCFFTGFKNYQQPSIIVSKLNSKLNETIAMERYTIKFELRMNQE